MVIGGRCEFSLSTRPSPRRKAMQLNHTHDELKPFPCLHATKLTQSVPSVTTRKKEKTSASTRGGVSSTDAPSSAEPPAMVGVRACACGVGKRGCRKAGGAR